MDVGAALVLGITAGGISVGLICAFIVAYVALKIVARGWQR